MDRFFADVGRCFDVSMPFGHNIFLLVYGQQGRLLRNPHVSVIFSLVVESGAKSRSPS